MSLAIALILLLLSVGCGGSRVAPDPGQGNQQTERLKIVTTTSLISEIAESVGGDKVEVISIIPPASCPGHFDVKPDDVKILSDSTHFMLHNWQGEKFSEALIKSAGNADLQKIVYDIKGNWMVPPVRLQAIDMITADLSGALPENQTAFSEAAAKMQQEVIQVATEQKKRLNDKSTGQINALANDNQAGFVKWAGLNVVGTFSRAEDMSPKDIEDLINLGRDNNVTLVVDNLQSGKETGIGIAKEIGAAQVTLNNFPGGSPGTDNWAEAIKKNVDLILENIPK